MPKHGHFATWFSLQPPHFPFLSLVPSVYLIIFSSIGFHCGKQSREIATYNLIKQLSKLCPGQDVMFHYQKKKKNYQKKLVKKIPFVVILPHHPT
jgi:hypothetical protein